MQTFVLNAAVGVGTHTLPMGQSFRAGVAVATQPRAFVVQLKVGTLEALTDRQLPCEGIEGGALKTAPATPSKHCELALIGVHVLCAGLTVAHEVPAEHEDCES
jgi:hypothetical protein